MDLKRGGGSPDESRFSLREKVPFRGANGNVDEPPLRRLLDDWLDRRIIAHLDGRYLSLALRAPDRDEG